MSTIDIPFCVDLDGTLINTDLLIESGLSFVGNSPIQSIKAVSWLFNGKATLKEKLAEQSSIDVTTLPYNEDVIALIEEQRKLGRRIVLATASHQSLADMVAEHLGLFDQVLATKDNINLSATRKRDALVRLYGERGFDYVGNSHDDVVVWQAARKAYVVSPEFGVESAATKGGNVEKVINQDTPRFRAWLKALRVHQWMKNSLIFVPLLAAHELSNVDLILNGLLAFFIFGLCASSVYLLNDLIDLDDDRHHGTKKERPFAAGKLSVKSGILLFPTLLLAAFCGAYALLPWLFTAVLLSYYLLTVLYSFYLKRIMALDVIALALLYTVRIIAGAAAFGLQLTFWMLAFSMFIFLSLALVKRYAELHEARQKGRTEKTRGRGYFPQDLEMVSSLGAAAGYLSVMVLALYIHDQTTVSMYSYPQAIWVACPLLLFWVTRIWMLTHRGEMQDDPVVFAINDRTSLLIGALFGLVFWVAV